MGKYDLGTPKSTFFGGAFSGAERPLLLSCVLSGCTASPEPSDKPNPLALTLPGSANAGSRPHTRGFHIRASVPCCPNHAPPIAVTS